LFQPADLYSNTTLADKPKVHSITPFKRIPQARIGEGGPEINGNNTIADDPLIMIPSTVSSTYSSSLSAAALLASSSQEEQLLEMARRAFVGARFGSVAAGSASSPSSATSTGAYQELEQKYRELEARLAALTPAPAPVQPVVSQSDISAALSGLRSSGTKRRKA
jgi:hypothetical protein